LVGERNEKRRAKNENKRHVAGDKKVSLTGWRGTNLRPLSKERIRHRTLFGGDSRHHFGTSEVGGVEAPEEQEGGWKEKEGGANS